MLQREWSDNMVSCTVYFDKENEDCGSNNVIALATMSWDVDRQKWGVDEMVERSQYCYACALPVNFKDVLID